MKNILLILSFLSLTQLTYASNLKDKPTCPSINAIQSAGVNSAVKSPWVGWTGINISKYDSEVTWGLAVFAGNEAKDESEAIKIANSQLKLIKLVVGPSDNDGRYEWNCKYIHASKHELIAWAVTPPPQ